jgi:hypothetical protein
MREMEDAGDDGDGVAGADAMDDEVLGDAVGEDDERGDEEEVGAAVVGVAGWWLLVAGCWFGLFVLRCSFVELLAFSS